MGYRFPPNRLKDSEVIDIERANENFQAIVEEASSKLNEHNWEDKAFVSATQVKADRDIFANTAAYRLFRESVSSDAVLDPQSGLFSGGDVEESQAWATVPDLTKTFTSQGGMVYVIGSCGVFNHVDNSAPRPDRGSHFAIRVDGQVITESIVGGEEPMQEDLNRTATSKLHSFGQVRFSFPVCSEAIMMLAPGVHTIEMVIRSDVSTKRSGININCRELDVVYLTTARLM